MLEHVTRNCPHEPHQDTVGFIAQQLGPQSQRIRTWSSPSSSRLHGFGISTGVDNDSGIVETTWPFAQLGIQMDGWMSRT